MYNQPLVVPGVVPNEVDLFSELVQHGYPQF